MKVETLDCIDPLLAVLHGYSVLREVRPTVFHLDGRDFIHFHVTPKVSLPTYGSRRGSAHAGVQRRRASGVARPD